MPYSVKVGEPTVVERGSINPRIYGPDWGDTDPRKAGGMGTLESAVPPETGNLADTIRYTAPFAEGQAKLRENAKEKASMLDSAEAAARGWVINKAVDFVNGPAYEPMEGYNPTQDIARLGYELSTEERDTLQRTGSPAEFDYKEFQISRTRRNNSIAADHPVVAFATGALDPDYWVFSVLTGGWGAFRIPGLAGAVRSATGSAAAGRAASMAAWGGFEGAVIAAEPVDLTLPEIMGRVALATAAGAITPAGPKAPRRAAGAVDDATHALEFPHKELTAIADDMATPAHVKGRPSAPHIEARQQATVLQETAEIQPVGTKVATPLTVVEDASTRGDIPTLPKELRGAKPRYSYQNKQFTLEFESDVDRAAYIASQTNRKSKHDAAYVAYVQEATGMTEEQVRAYGSKIRDQIKADAMKAAGGGKLPVRKSYWPDTKRPKVAAAPPTSRVRSAEGHIDALDVPTTPTGRTRPTSSARTILSELTSHTDPMIAQWSNIMLERLGGLVDDITVHYVPKSDLVGGTRPYYVADTHAIYIHKTTAAQDIVHEVGHGLTVHKLLYGMANPETVHGKMATQLAEIAADARKAAQKRGGLKDGSGYYLGLEKADEMPGRAKGLLKDVDPNTALQEFVAGLWSGNDEFHKLLASMPDRYGVPILTKVIDTVRRLFGMAPTEQNALTRAMHISDELMKAPLNVTFSSAEGAQLVSRRMAMPRTPKDIVAAIDKQETALAQRLGQKLAWNSHKQMSSYGKVGEEVADILADNPVNMTKNGATSQQRAIRADLTAPQYAFEDLLVKQYAAEGYGPLKRIHSKEALEVHKRIMDDVYFELMQRDAGGILTDVPHVKAMADEIDKAYKASLIEMQKAGVKGAEEITTRSGFVNRRWDVSSLERLEARLISEGASAKDAAKTIRGLLSDSIMTKNGWEREVADDVASAIIGRTKVKGMFDDVAALRGAGDDSLKEFRDVMIEAGIPEARMQRALDRLVGQVDEAGKPNTLKRRIDMDMFAEITHPDGSTTRVMDLVDRDVTRLLDQYLDKAAGEAALARVGLDTTSKIGSLRNKLAKSIPNLTERQEAVKLFDNWIDAIKGNPVGEEMGRGLRMLQTLTHMVSLGAAALWQFTEFAPIIARFGAGNTFKYMVKEFPGFREMLGGITRDPAAATQFKNILWRNAAQDMRIRPFISKMEDNFQVALSDHTMIALQQAKQLVPYLNCLRYMQSYQARVSANLITDVLVKAAGGDAKAIAALAKYGLESHVLGAVSADISKHGLDTAKWSAGTWDRVRGPIGKMVDESVLRARTGEVPAFAQFSTVGKFIFTYRSFVLAAHNKVLAGTLGRDGLAGLGLAMVYQLPMSMLATLANNTISGKKEMTEEELLKASISQMGMLGLASEIYGAVSGTKQQFGSPGHIFVDRTYKLTGAASNAMFGDGSAGNVGAALLGVTPLWSTTLPLKGIGEQLKD